MIEETQPPVRVARKKSAPRTPETGGRRKSEYKPPAAGKTYSTKRERVSPVKGKKVHIALENQVRKGKENHSSSVKEAAAS